MATEQLKIVLTAETKQAQKQLDDFVRTTQGVSKALPALAKGANNANFAVLNLGRVAQDSAFGFIGIANNLEPLFQSFAQLRRESSSTGAAVKAFFGSLLGVGGIGVLIGAVQLFDSYSKGYGFFAGRAKQAADAQKDFNKELEQARAGALSTGVQLQALIKIANDSTQSDTIRANALKQINEQTEQYGIKIDKVAIANGEASKAVDLLTKSIVAQAVASKLSDRVAELTIKQAEAIRDYAKAKNELIAAAPGAKVALDVQQATGAFAVGGVQASNAGEGIAKYSNAVRSATNSADAYKIVTKELQQVFSLLNDAQAEALKYIKTGQPDPDKTKQTSDATVEYYNNISRLRDSFLGLNAVTDASKIFNEASAQTLKDQSKSIADFVKLVQGGAQAPQNASFAGGIPAAIQAARLQNEELQKELRDNTLVQVENIKNGFALLSPLIDQAFNALANGENAFDSLLQGVKRLIIELIKAAALAAILAAVTGGASGAGVNGVAGFKNIFASLLGFGRRAGGGPVAGGSPYLVGENGPELFVPGASGRVVSNNMLAGGGSLVARVSGNDLLFLMQKAGNNRNAWR